MNSVRRCLSVLVKALTFMLLVFTLSSCGKVWVQFNLRNNGGGGSGGASNSSNILSRQWTIEDGTAGGSAYGGGITLDSSGNIYVTGNTSGAGIDGNTLIGDQDLFITKYNSSGTRQWTVEDGTPSIAMVYGYGIATDTVGNIYVSGSTSSGGLDGNTATGLQDVIITKYNSSGSRQWTVEDGTSGGVALSQSIALDSSNNVYVTGATWFKGYDGNTLKGSRDFIITKYNSSGVHQWTVEDGAVHGDAWGEGIVADSSGNVYVTGTTSGAGIDGNALIGSCDYFITKYNSSGSRQWTVEDGTAGGNTEGYGITLDSSGNIYVTGYTVGAGIDGHTLIGTMDLFITKYNSSGSRQWTVEDGTAGGSASGGGITLDSSGNIYVTGDTSGAGIDGHALQGNRDLFITKYSSTGTRLSTIEDGTSGGLASGTGIVVDSSGDPYVSGYSYGAGLDGHTPNGNQDFILTKY